MKTWYYIETDGQVFLVKKAGRLTFPESRDEVPFPFTIAGKIALPQARVLYCRPQLQAHPSHWPHKDDIPGMDVDPLVRLAVNRSLVRHVSEAIIPRGSSVLMVKGKRGYTKGFFTLPGGFITFGETPEQSLAREVKEETGLEARVQKLVHIYAGMSSLTKHYILMLIYLCEPVGGELRKNPDEIEEIAWLPIDQAIAAAKSSFIRHALRLHKKSLG